MTERFLGCLIEQTGPKRTSGELPTKWSVQSAQRAYLSLATGISKDPRFPTGSTVIIGKKGGLLPREPGTYPLVGLEGKRVMIEVKALEVLTENPNIIDDFEGIGKKGKKNILNALEVWKNNPE